MQNQEKKWLITQCMAHVASHNWLIHSIMLPALLAAAENYAQGNLLDLGCATKPWKPLFEPFISTYIGLDHLQSLHPLHQVDIVASVYHTGIQDNLVDTVLSTAVLEHLECPQDALNEMYRVLKPGGKAILTVPLFWHLHEQPRDFFRYTEFGLAHLCSQAGFEIVEIKPLAGFIVTFFQELVYFLNRLRRNYLNLPVLGLQAIIQRLAYFLNRWDRSYEFTWMYLVIAQKPVSS